MVLLTNAEIIEASRAINRLFEQFEKQMMECKTDDDYRCAFFYLSGWVKGMKDDVIVKKMLLIHECKSKSK